MARVLKIANSAQTVDLQSNFYLMPGWEPITSLVPVWENLPLHSANSDTNMRAYEEDLNQLAQEARDYISKPERDDPVYFYWQGEGESAKRVLLRDLRVTIRSRDNAAGPMQGFSQGYLDVQILRDPDYESSTTTSTGVSGIDTVGGLWLIGNAAGAVPQRIKSLGVSPGDSGTTFTDVWVGIRDLNEGTTGFSGVWEAEDGTNVTDATDVGPVPASGGAAVEISFSSTSGMDRRSTILAGSVLAGNYDDLVGSYLVLGSFSVDTGVSANVRLMAGWSGGYAQYNGAIVGETFLTEDTYANLGTSYFLYELGTVTIPIEGYRDGWSGSATHLASWGFSLFAERVSGSGSIFFDCLILIPTDHLFKAKFSTFVANGSVSVFTSPEGEQRVSYLTSGGGPQLSPLEFSINRWNYPIGGGLLVCAAQHNSNGIAISGTADVSIAMLPRWSSYRT